jgi:hypothetical protein
VTGVLPSSELEHAFSLDAQLQYVDDIFDRVFEGAPVEAAIGGRAIRVRD